MTALWTAGEAAAATGGTARGDWQATGVSIDTRTIQPGDLFVALKDSRDGHEFVADALAKGAAAALVSHVPDGVAEDAPLLIVQDVLRGLEGMARAARARSVAQVIAVTGSVGKTSTKEMLRTVLEGQGRTHAAEKSYNNHWGVPLTLARMPADTEFAAIEIGMNRPGEIAPLAKLARPHVAIVTTVAPVHLEAFEDINGIAREKASIFEGLEPDGLAIFNNDLETSPILARAANAMTRTRHFCFGEEALCDWRLVDAQVVAGRTIASMRHMGHELIFKLAAPGRHFAMNAVAVLAAADAVGADLGLAVLDLGNWSPPAGRGQRHFVTLDPVNPEIGIDLFDDAYNANPASVGAALDVLAGAVLARGGGQRVAILGDMKELGPTEHDLHAALADHPAMAKIGTVHCVGPLMRSLHEALPVEKRGLWSETAEALAAKPNWLIAAGDVALVKGSLSMKMALVVDAIRNLGQSVEGKTEGTP